jgi:hypothetical protein
MRVDVHGDGLLPHIAKLIGRPLVAHEARARAIHTRLPEHPVRVAEIGVFVGMLSRELLRRPDLELLMVDSWESGDGAYPEGGLSDFHATLSQEKQDHIYKTALWNTEFAKDRRHVHRMRSTDAARMVPDGSLDCVFVDANHSYDACKSDIDAWLPKLKPGGLLSGHDYDHPDFPLWGVKRAVDEFAAATGLPLETGENFTWFIRLPAEGLQQAA